MKFLKALGKICLFVVVYSLLYFVLGFIIFCLANWSDKTQFLWPVIKFLSWFSPTIVSFSPDELNNAVVSFGFNQYFLIFNILYSYLIYKAVWKKFKF